MTTYIIWAVLALLALGQPGTRAMAPSEVLGVHADANSHELQGKTYVALGDSISAGRYATAQDETFPYLVADKLGMNLRLVARSGTKAGWGVEQVAAVNAARPSLVTVELGTNDVGFRTPLEQFATQYDAILAGVSNGGTRVLCIGSWLPSDPIDTVIADACARHGDTYVSLRGFYAVNAFHAADGGQSYLGRTDWFHPGDQGHSAIAAAVVSALGAGPPPVIGPIPTPSPASGIIRTRPY